MKFQTMLVWKVAISLRWFHNLNIWVRIKSRSTHHNFGCLSRLYKEAVFWCKGILVFPINYHIQLCHFSLVHPNLASCIMDQYLMLGFFIITFCFLLLFLLCMCFRIELWFDDHFCKLCRTFIPVFTFNSEWFCELLWQLCLLVQSSVESFDQTCLSRARWSEQKNINVSRNIIIIILSSVA